MRYQARFTAQVWQNDYAVLVDAEGPDTWDCTDYMLALTPAQREAALVPDTYDSDDVRNGPNTPAWVRDWSGPFYITVEQEDV